MPSEQGDKVVPYTIFAKKTEYNNNKNKNIENQKLFFQNCKYFRHVRSVQRDLFFKIFSGALRPPNPQNQGAWRAPWTPSFFLLPPKGGTWRAEGAAHSPPVRAKKLKQICTYEISKFSFLKLFSHFSRIIVILADFRKNRG